MVVIPGDRARIGSAPVVTVAEAYLHTPHLVEIISTGGRVWWVDPDLVRRIDPVSEQPPAVPLWRR
jgi:hypothetical protein